MSKSNNAIPSNCHQHLLNAFQPTQQCWASPERSPPKRPRRSPGSSQTAQFHARRLGNDVNVFHHCITLHDSDKRDSTWYHWLLHSGYYWTYCTALSLSPSLTVFGFALGEETHQHIDRKSDPGQGLKKPSHVQVLIYADFWAYWNSSTVSQLATNLWTR